ncbi:hypothetical protein [Ferrimonas senticii]|uniref:hypothetical protein n=1 Tax=Ferrimonas senticii TaxID=394566 RepID=UPI00040ED402|nr:hypothetical protein [Ferrimonas senticii]
MKLRFNFATARPVAHYARLCNQFLQHPNVKAIRHNDQGYAIEAEGEQPQLEQLADLLAATLPLSCWSTGTSTEAIEQFSGEAQELPYQYSDIAYCRHCLDKPTEDCRHCGTPADAVVDIDALVADFVEVGRASYRNHRGRRTVVALSQITAEHQQLMFCNGKDLNQALYIDNDGVLRLSGIEKPQLRLQPRPAFSQQHQLPRPLYNCHLADDRIAHQLALRLAERGVVAVAVECDYQPLLIAQWLNGPAALAGDPALTPLAVREPQQYSAHVGHYRACYHNDKVKLTRCDISKPVEPTKAAEYALQAMQQQQRFDDSTAVLYLSRQHQSGVIYKDRQGQIQWLVKLDYQDANPADRLTALASSSASAERLIERFQAKHGDWLAQLTATNHRRPRGNLSGIMAMVAWLWELDGGHDVQIAAEALLASALGHNQLKAPRIDFRLRKGEDAAEVDFLPALQAAISYRLADPDGAAGVAFGVIDSFADFVGNWIERLDADIGLSGLVLAGDEFDNPILLQQLRLRLARNIKLSLPQPLDIAGNNLALGALFCH